MSSMCQASKMHIRFQHKLFEKAFKTGTTSRSTRRKCLFSWFQRRTHKHFVRLAGRLSQGQEQKVYVFVPFFLSNVVCAQERGLSLVASASGCTLQTPSTFKGERYDRSKRFRLKEARDADKTFSGQ